MKRRMRRTYRRRVRRRFNRAVKKMSRRLVRGVGTATFTRTTYIGNWTPSTGAITGFWQYLSWDIGSFPDWASLSGIYESYKVRWLEFTLRPRYDGFAGNDTTDTTLPGTTAQGTTMVHTIVDPKSNVLPSGTYSAGTLNTFLQYGNVRTFRGTRPIRIMIRYPCIYDDINGTTNQVLKKAPWISTPNAITHRGVHVFLQDVNLTGTFNQSFDIFVKARVTFTGAK